MFTREELMDKVIEVYGRLCDANLRDEAEDILLKYNASEDDSDAKEGFFVTMSKEDMMNAFKEMQDMLDNIDNYQEFDCELTLTGKQINLMISALQQMKARNNEYRKDIDAILRQLF